MEADKRIEELEEKVAALEVQVQEQPDVEMIAEAIAKRLINFRKKGAITMTKDILNSEISELREEIKVKILKKIVKTLDAENLNPIDLQKLMALIDSLAKL